MAKYNTAMITNTGKKLLADTLAGISKLKFYCIALGNGIYEGQENLQEATALKSKKQETALNSIEKVSENCVKIKALISNENLTEGYYITEMGLYAIDELNENSYPILYSVVTAEKPDFFPEYNGKTPVTILQEYYASVSETIDVDIFINDDAFTLLEDFENYKKYINNIVYAEAKNKDGGNADTVDGYHADDLKGYTDKKVAELVDSAPETLNTLDELAKAVKDYSYSACAAYS